MATTRKFLAEVLNQISSNEITVNDGVEKILTKYPRIDDHAGEAGYWNTSDKYGNIAGPFDTFEDATAHGGWPYWMEEEDEDED